MRRNPTVITMGVAQPANPWGGGTSCSAAKNHTTRNNAAAVARWIVIQRPGMLKPPESGVSFSPLRLLLP